MAESSGDKSEQASDHKLRKMREEGQVARSRDLATAVGLVATLQVTALFMPDYLRQFHGLFQRGLADASGPGAIDSMVGAVWADAARLFLQMLLPLFITPVLTGLASLVPGGWLLSLKNLQPKFGRLSPKQNLSKFFKSKHYGDLLMAVLKVLAVAGVVYAFCKANMRHFTALPSMTLDLAVREGVSLFLSGVMSIVIIFVILALIDVPLQRFFFLRGQRMSKQEVKEEHKSNEGRPEVKSRIRQIQRQLARRSVRATVPQADAVIVNPEHYAVAVRYDTQRAEAPFVIAKGVDEMAFYIREIAQRHQVEVVSLPPLARAIYHSSQVNQQIPAVLYRSVAQVLHYVLQIKAFRQGQRPARPEMPQALDVPAELSDPPPAP
ncbi:flagellar type III secretion system protein FlhB [Comamonas guangdongensis]|uniref:Flagellar type III secretion system protein FlhB n=1 Tax=Comamonas guangdongensis TaxID=510515 RepID=A0ABV3ZRU8_9BURK